MAWTGLALQTLLSYQVKTFDGCADWVPTRAGIRPCLFPRYSLQVVGNGRNQERAVVKSLQITTFRSRALTPFILIFGAAPDEATEDADLQELQAL